MPSTDPDGDEIEHRFAWSRDGEPASVDGPEVAADLTARGEVWEVTVTPNDGLVDGTPAVASITIGNTPPAIDEIRIFPAEPTTDDSLTCTVVASDIDDDAVDLSYTWLVDGFPAGFDSAVIDPVEFDKGQVVTCIAAPADDADDGEPATAEITIVDSPPSVTNVRIQPATPRTFNTLQCSAEAEDPDGDDVSVTFAWRVNGQLVAETSSSLPFSRTSRGDVVDCEVTPDDGEATGSVVSSQVTVMNAAPTAPSASVTPEVFVPEQDALVCAVTADALDADADPLTYTVAWTVDGQAYPSAFPSAVGPTLTSLPGDTVPPEDNDLGLEWTCTIAASDGVAIGPGGSATALSTCAQLTIAILPRFISPQDRWTDVEATAADYGPCELTFVDMSAGFTLQDLLDTGARVLLRDGTASVTYTTDEHNAVLAFLQGDHGGLVVTSELLRDNYDHSALAALVGVDSSFFELNHRGILAAPLDLDPTHPMAAGFATTSGLSPGGLNREQRRLAGTTWQDALLPGASLFTQVANDGPVTVVYDAGDWRGVWYTWGFESQNNTTADGDRLAYNGLVWAAGYVP